MRACDLYDGRHTLAREITAKPDLPVTRRYQELLDNKDIDCIVAAVPDHWHKQVVIDAVSAGKDIYCEKPMSHTAAEGVGNGRCREADRPHRADRIATRQLADLRKGEGNGLSGHARRSDDGGGLARPQRSHRSLGISAAARPFSADSRLGHLARHRRRSGPSDPRFSRAGAAGRNMARASPAICSCIWSAG